jgi:hypothetical protein
MIMPIPIIEWELIAVNNVSSTILEERIQIGLLHQYLQIFEESKE